VLLDHIAGQDTRAGTVPVVLDTVEVDLAEVVVCRGRRRAWSDRGPAVVALTSRAGAYGPGAR